MRQKRMSPLKMMLCAICAFSLLYVGTRAVFAASFDCKKARSYAEKTICATPELSSADSRLSELYKQAKAVQGNSKEFRNLASANWLKREACRDVACLQDWYINSFYLYERWAGQFRTKPSFNCAKARSYAEQAVCAIPALSSADNRLGRLYTKAKTVQGNSKHFRDFALTNWQKREACRDISCIQAWYIKSADIYERMIGGRWDGGYVEVPASAAPYTVPPVPVAPVAPPVQSAPGAVEQACVFIVTDRGMGSGFFVAPGCVATNAHVVEGANMILVTSQAMRGPSLARIVAVNESGARDYAVLRLDPDTCDNIHPLVFAAGTHRAERVGAWGFPDIISSNDPKFQSFIRGDFRAAPGVSYSEGVVMNLLEYTPTMIAHSAQISPGNSGGPLVNASGDVVGINTLTRRDEGYNRIFYALSGRDLLLFLRNNGIPAQSR